MTITRVDAASVSGPTVAPAVRLAAGLTIAVIAWGALSFGAVYAWAYWPLAAAAQLTGWLSLFAVRSAAAGVSRSFAIVLMVVAAAVFVQLVPLPRQVLDALSPVTSQVLDRFALGFGPGSSHPLSIHPSSTWTGLALLASFSLLMVGTSRLLSVRGAAGVITAVAVFGGALAIAGIAQRSFPAGQIYGFWTPEMGGNPFGPFVNKNHFAGWMLMGLPLTLGLLCAGVTRGIRGIEPGLRGRALWCTSPEASKLVLLAGAAAIMALSLVLTMARSGMIALVLALMCAGWCASRRHSRMSSALAISGVVLAALFVAVWAGLDGVLSHFYRADWMDLNGRLGPWQDAWHIAGNFPLFGTGFNTYGIATLFFQRHNLALHYAEAHNDYLQLAAEGGLLLTIPVLVCAVIFVRDVRRRFREDAGSSAYWVRAGAVTGLLAITLQEMVEFSLQMPGNAAFFAVLCGVALHRPPARRI